ncbi:MAG: heavy metal-associated domain-containing protein [Candidatus Aenigmatarchaeota archaeon]
MKDDVIKIMGMHCKSCAEKVESRLSRLKGVERVKVSMPNEEASIRYDPKQISVADMEEEITGLGYGVGSERPRNPSPSPSPAGARGGVLQAIAYGIVPHIGCIGFIVATVLGVTVATELFKPLLMNPYFFYILIGVSFVFATISSVLYLRQQGFISFGGSGGQFEVNVARNTLHRKWKYLAAMYGTTIMINIALFFFVFPALANVSFGQAVSGLPMTGDVGLVGGSPGTGLSSLTMRVDIPCSGHAPLITGELRKLPGVRSVNFAGSNTFNVAYDPAVASKSEILAIDVFNVYKATVLGESSSSASSGTAASPQPRTQQEPEFEGSCGCGCGGGSGGCDG